MEAYAASTLRAASTMIGVRGWTGARQQSNRVRLALQHSHSIRLCCSRHVCRSLQTSSGQRAGQKIPNFAFAFDIDGVLLRGQDPLPKAGHVLTYLQKQSIPHILLTNGGGYHEDERADRLSRELGVRIDARHIIQSHTPFSKLEDLKGKTVLVVGGEYDNCRLVAEKYGFKRVVTPSEIYTAYPSVWPFSTPFEAYHNKESRPVPLPLPIRPNDLTNSLKIDAIFVYNDSRDWGLDASIIIDCLLSHQGYLGTLSPKNNTPNLPNHGYQQDGQPALYFSNPDLWFAAKFNLPRLGQGGFRWALEGLWSAITNSRETGVRLETTVMGKPFGATFQFAEERLRELHNEAYGEGAPTIQKILMTGDNPESDIRGATTYQSPFGSQWYAALVKTGVYTGGSPTVQPSVFVPDVFEAVNWFLKKVQWRSEMPEA